MSHDHLCVSLVPLFNHLDLEDQKKINNLMIHEIVEKKTQVIDPYKESQLLIVAKGNLKVYQLSSNGKEQLLRIVEPGGYEGENELFGVKNDEVFAESLEKTELCILKQSDFKQLLIQYPELSLKLLEINAEKSLKMERQTQFLVMEKIEERLATYLLNLSKVQASNQIEIPMKMKELAAFLGTTPETLSRKFKYLEEESIIKRNRNNVHILNVDELENI